MLFTLLSLMLVSGWQIYRLYSLRSDVKTLKLKAKPFTPAFERKKKLEEENENFQKKIENLLLENVKVLPEDEIYKEMAKDLIDHRRKISGKLSDIRSRMRDTVSMLKATT